MDIQISPITSMRSFPHSMSWQQHARPPQLFRAFAASFGYCFLNSSTVSLTVCAKASASITRVSKSHTENWLHVLNPSRPSRLTFAREENLTHERPQFTLPNFGSHFSARYDIPPAFAVHMHCTDRSRGGKSVDGLTTGLRPITVSATHRVQADMLCVVGDAKHKPVALSSAGILVVVLSARENRQSMR